MDSWTLASYLPDIIYLRGPEKKHCPGLMAFLATILQALRLYCTCYLLV